MDVCVLYMKTLTMDAIEAMCNGRLMESPLFVGGWS